MGQGGSNVPNGKRFLKSANMQVNGVSYIASNGTRTVIADRMTGSGMALIYFDGKDINNWKLIQGNAGFGICAGLAYGNGYFFIKDISCHHFSPDGVNWTYGESYYNGSKLSISNICYGNGKFVGSTTDGIYIFSGIPSTSMSWSLATSALNDAIIGDWSYIRWTGDRFLVCCNGDVSGGKTIYYSLNGLSWIKASVSENLWIDSTYGKSSWLALSKDGTLCKSINGTSFTVLPTSLPSPASGCEWRRLVYANGLFIAFQSNCNIYAYSSDMQNWTVCNASGSFGLAADVFYQDDMILITDGGYYTYYSMTNDL